MSTVQHSLLSSLFAHTVTGSSRVTVLGLSRLLGPFLNFSILTLGPFHRHTLLLSTILLPNLPFYRPPDSLLVSGWRPGSCGADLKHTQLCGGGCFGSRVGGASRGCSSWLCGDGSRGTTGSKVRNGSLR